MTATADPTNEKARSFIDTFLGEPKPPKVAEPPKVEDPVEPPKIDPKKEEPAKPAETVKAAEAAADPAAPVEPAKAEPAKADPAPKKTKAKAPEPSPVDYTGVVEAAARGVAEAMAKQPPRAAEPAGPKLPDQEARRVNYLKQLETMFPDKYKDVAARYERSYHAVEKYQHDWEAENPGETFDAEDPLHSTFLTKHSVDWEDEDYAEAVAEVKVSAMRRETEQRHADTDRRRSLEPAARAAGRTHSDKVLADLGADLKMTAGIIGDNLTINPEQMGKLLDEDPIKGPVVAKAAEFAANFIAESNRLFNGVTNFDEKKPLHNTINDFAMAKEKALLALPREQQLDSEGRNFVATSEFYKLPAAKRARSWTLQAEDIAYLATQEIVADAKKSIAAEEARIERILKSRGVASQKAPAAPAVEATKTAPPAASKPVSPSGGTDPKLAGVKGDPSSDSQVRWTTFQNRFLGVK